MSEHQYGVGPQAGCGAGDDQAGGEAAGAGMAGGGGESTRGQAGPWATAAGPSQPQGPAGAAQPGFAPGGHAGAMPGAGPGPAAPGVYGPPGFAGHAAAGGYGAQGAYAGEGAYAGYGYGPPQHWPMPPAGYYYAYAPAGAAAPGNTAPMGDAAGQGRRAGMAELIEELGSGGNGLSSLSRILNLDDSEFWKGALVGAAAVLLLTNDSVQDALFKTGARAKGAVQGGVDKLKERADDASTKTADQE